MCTLIGSLSDVNLLYKKGVNKMEDCSTCKYLDPVFGGCCHPKSGGTVNIHKAKECLDNNHLWWEESNYVKVKLLSNEIKYICDQAVDHNHSYKEFITNLSTRIELDKNSNFS